MFADLLSFLPVMVSALAWAFNTVPEVLWSGLIAAGVAFIGSLIAALISFFGVRYAGNLSARGLATQLDAQRKLAEDERLFNFKKQCYIELAEEAVSANMTLGNLIKGRHQELLNMESLSGFARANAKLALVADTWTLTAASDLSTALVSTLLGLVHGLDPLFKLNIDIDIEQGNLDDHFKKIFQMQDEQRTLTYAGDFTSQHRKSLDGHIAHHMEKASEARQELEAMRAEAATLMHEANLVFAERMVEISALQNELLKAIRASVGVSTDLDTYIAKTAAAGIAIKNQSVELTAKFARVLPERPAESTKIPDENARDQ